MTATELQKRSESAYRLRVLQTESGQFFVESGEGKILFDWLKFLYPIWAEMDPEAVHVSAKIGLSELVLSGCTTVADHLYLYPNGSKIDDEIQAAVEVGVPA